MSGAISRFIPPTRPRQAVTVPLRLRENAVGPRTFPAELVPAGSRVLACSGIDVEPAADVGRVTLVGLDAAEGAETFRLAFPDRRETPPSEVSLPAAAPDGRIAQLLRRENRVTLVEADPATGRVTEVRPSVPTLPRTSSAIFSVFPGPAGWIASFGPRIAMYGVSGRTECLRDPGRPVWAVANEEAMGVVGETVVLRARGEAKVLGRRADSGEIAWEAELAEGSLAELHGGAVLVFDPQRRAAERFRRDQAFLRERATRVATDPIGARGVDWDAQRLAFERREGRLPATPVRALNAATGMVRFRVELAGDPVGPIVGGPHLACLVVLDEEGVGGLVRLRSVDGVEVGRRGFHVDEEFFSGIPVPVPDLPRLLAADHTHLLWRDRNELVCEVLADPGREVWRLPLPETEPLALLAHAGHLYLRFPDSLSIWAAGGE